MGKQGNKLKIAFEDACLNYIECFLNKQNLKNANWAWDLHGVLLYINTYLIAFDELRFDIDNHIKPGLFVRYLDRDVDCYFEQLEYKEWLTKNMLL
jgi:hypothetical protein